MLDYFSNFQNNFHPLSKTNYYTIEDIETDIIFSALSAIAERQSDLLKDNILLLYPTFYELKKVHPWTMDRSYQKDKGIIYLLNASIDSFIQNKFENILTTSFKIVEELGKSVTETFTSNLNDFTIKDEVYSIFKLKIHNDKIIKVKKENGL